MEINLDKGLQGAAAAVSLVLMGICGVRLLLRLIALLRGRETADGLNTPDGTIVEPSEAKPAPAACVMHAPSPLRAMLCAALVTLASRLLLYALAYALYRGLGIGEKSFFESFESMWTHWDTRHYIGIARNGYTAIGDDRLRLVFFPLYPLLMRLFSPLTGGSVFFGGVLVSLLCAAASGALLYDLCRMHWGDRAARLSLAYFLLNPLSVFLGCVYTESLFISLTLLAVWLLRRDRPWLAALCGAASAFTRMPGVVVAGLFLIRLLGEIPKGRFTRQAVLRCAGQMLTVFSGLFAYWAVNWIVTGEPFTYMTYQAENWYQRPGTFWNSTSNTMHYFLTTAGDGDWLFTWGFQLIAMLYAYALLAAREDVLPFDLAAYAFVYVAVVFAPTWLLSGARYLFALAALPMLQARAHKSPAAHALALSVCGALLVLWTYGFTIAVEVL